VAHGVGGGRCSLEVEGGRRAPFWLLGEGGEVARWAAARSSTRAMAKKALGRLELERTERRMAVCRGRLSTWKRSREGDLIRHGAKEGERGGGPIDGRTRARRRRVEQLGGQGSGASMEGGHYGKMASGLARGIRKRKKKWARPKATMPPSNYSKKFK
jgi:hypothetical protein